MRGCIGACATELTQNKIPCIISIEGTKLNLLGDLGERCRQHGRQHKNQGMKPKTDMSRYIPCPQLVLSQAYGIHDPFPPRHMG